MPWPIKQWLVGLSKEVKLSVRHSLQNNLELRGHSCKLCGDILSVWNTSLREIEIELINMDSGLIFFVWIPFMASGVLVGVLGWSQG